MISITIFTFNPFQENTYVVAAANGDCIIIDAGNYSAAEDRQLNKHIAEHNLNPIMAFNTHGHVDHILGVEYVRESYDIPFAIHGDDKFLIDSAVEHGGLYGFNVRAIPGVDVDLKGVIKMTLGETEFELIHTPGHTPGHISLYHPQSKSLFTGDTLFKESIGRTDLPGGDYSWIMKSILEKIIPLGGDVTIYPGHGAKSTIGHEMMYNPFVTEVLNGDVNYEN